MDVHHQWTKVMQLQSSCCHMFSVFFLFVFWPPMPVCLPAIWAASQLSQPAAADRVAEGEDQPPPWWDSGGPHGEVGTSAAHRRTLHYPQHLPQESAVPTALSPPQEPAGAHNDVGEVRCHTPLTPQTHDSVSVRKTWFVMCQSQWPLFPQSSWDGPLHYPHPLWPSQAAGLLSEPRPQGQTTHPPQKTVSHTNHFTYGIKL